MVSIDDEFQQVLVAIKRKWGEQAIGKASGYPTKTYTLTGFAELDSLIEGIPHGKITEFIGVPTVGLTTVIFRVMAACQQEGRIVVYFDLAEAFDPEYALACGVQVAEMLLLRPPDDLAAAMLFDLVNTGIPGVVVFNTALSKGRLKQHRLAEVLERLSSGLMRSKAILILTSGATAVSPLTALRLRFSFHSWVQEAEGVTGYHVCVRLEKFRGTGEGTVVQFPIMLPGSTSS